jgi:polar amino acid transport system substrate-binding protein
LEVSPQEKQNKMLYKERVDIVIADRYVFQDLNRMIAKDIDVTASLHHHMIFSGPDYYISFHDEALKNRFNRGLKTIRASGVYKQLEQQYFVDVETK